MRNLITTFLLVVFLYSCEDVKFTTPQPLDGKKLSSFPLELIGSYVDKKINLDVGMMFADYGPKSKMFFSIEKDKITFYENKSNPQTLTLGKELELRKHLSDYFLNIKIPGAEGWNCAIIHPKSNKEFSVKLIHDSEGLKKIKTITKVTVKGESNYVNISKQEFKKTIQKGAFTEFMSAQKLSNNPLTGNKIKDLYTLKINSSTTEVSKTLKTWVAFTEPQPRHGKTFNDIPSEFHGTFSSAEDKIYLQVRNKSITILSEHPEKVDLESYKYTLNNNLIIKELNKVLYVNLKHPVTNNWAFAKFSLDKYKRRNDFKKPETYISINTLNTQQLKNNIAKTKAYKGVGKEQLIKLSKEDFNNLTGYHYNFSSKRINKASSKILDLSDLQKVYEPRIDIVSSNIIAYFGGSSYLGYDGFGKAFYKDGGTYVGYWKKGKRNGKGTFTTSQLHKLTGDWVDGLMDGKGTIIWTIGDKYTGDFKKGQRNGKGTNTWKNGNT